MKGLRKKDLVDGKAPDPEPPQSCPRCESANTKFCYYNNYSVSQPRYFCKECRRHWTRGGSLRDVPIGGRFIFKNIGERVAHRRSNSVPTNPLTTGNSSCSSPINPRSQFYQCFRKRLINYNQLSPQQELPTNLAKSTTISGEASTTTPDVNTININAASAPNPLTSSLSPTTFEADGGRFTPASNSMPAAVHLINNPPAIHTIKSEIEFLISSASMGPVEGFHNNTTSKKPPHEQILLQQARQQILLQQAERAFTVGNINQPSSWAHQAFTVGNFSKSSSCLPSSSTTTASKPKQEWHQNAISPGTGYYLSNTTNSNTTTNDNKNSAGPSALDPIYWPQGNLPAASFGFMDHANLSLCRN